MNIAFALQNCIILIKKKCIYFSSKVSNKVQVSLKSRKISIVKEILDKKYILILNEVFLFCRNISALTIKPSAPASQAPSTKVNVS